LAKWRVGIDVGGTFTDVVAYSSSGGQLYVDKVPSTPKNPADGVLNGLSRLLEHLKGDEVEFLSHGTTVAVNAIIQGKGAKVGVLITDGFRDLPYIQARRQQTHRIDFFSDERRRLISSREMVQAIPERVGRGGEVLQPLDEDAVREAAKTLKGLGAQSIAVGYLFSFSHPEHEQRTKQILHEEVPEIPVSLSCEVMPRIREWPRFSTTYLDAIVGPVLIDYIRKLEDSFKEIGLENTPRYLMQANGGILPFEGLLNGSNAVYTLMSGPVAAVMGAYQLGKLDGSENMVVIDIGGTSCDIAFITEGRVNEISEWEIAGFDAYFPAVDVTSIGAGGGTIVWVDDAGYPHFGPQSAGADPGPACYGLQGTEPTVTDADLVLGFLNPSYFLGGRVTLRPDLAEKAIQEGLAKHIKTDVIEAAKGIVGMANQRMADEISVLVAQRGVDLREAVLVAGGGAGPVHAAFVAQELGIRKVLAPQAPGAFSAMGLLSVDVAHDYLRSDLALLHEISVAQFNEIFGEMESSAASDISAEGLPTDGIRFIRRIDIRYAGQGFELLVDLPSGKVDEKTKQEIADRFESMHQSMYGHAMPGEALEVVSYRLRAEVDIPKFDWGKNLSSSGVANGTPESHRPVHFPGSQGPVECPVYKTEQLPIQQVIPGPAIVEQADTTIVVPPGWSMKMGQAGLALEQTN
jgi:N-methylhydantoinase A